MIFGAVEGPSRGSTLVDARGRSVSMIDPINRSMVRRGGDIDGATLDRLAEEINPGARRQLCLMALMLGAAMLIVLGMTALNSRTAGRLNWNEFVDFITKPSLIPIGAYLVFILPWTIIAEKRKRRKKTYAVLLRNKRCPHCGYSLQGLAVDPADGATVCPECACAWKLDDPLIEQMCAGSCGFDFRNHRKRGVMIGVVLALAIMLFFGVILFKGIT